MFSSINLAPSTDPTVEKAQQDPHCPWFWMGVTAPPLTQSTDEGSLTFLVGYYSEGAALVMADN